MNKLKIIFILPNIGLSGGVKAVFEFANLLLRMGHDVVVVYPMVPMKAGGKWFNPGVILRRGRELVKNLKNDAFVDWFDLKAELIGVPTLAEKHIPRADIVVATWWETAYFVNEYKRDRGEKFYLIQHYEVWGGLKEDVDRSYKLGLRNVVNSSWLKDILENKLGAEVEALIPHAPDLEQFYPEEVERDEGVRVLMPYRNIEWKGVKDGVRAFDTVRQKRPEIRLVMFGPEKGDDVPEHAEFHESPSNDELRRLYNSCDIFVFPSHCEGFGMPPMEAMACRRAVATTDVGAVPDYTVPGVTALVSPPNSPEPLAENILKLIEDKGLRGSIAEAGRNHIVKNFNWAKAAEALERTFIRVLKEKKPE